jgi:hypothetical protein
MVITEMLEQSAEAISSTHQQILWSHCDGDIILDFDDRTIKMNGTEYHPILLKKLLDVCANNNFEMVFHTCLCQKCTAERNQHN